MSTESKEVNMYVCLSDATSEDGLMERVNNRLYTIEEMKNLLRFDRMLFFVTVSEYESAKRKGYCR